MVDVYVLRFKCKHNDTEKFRYLISEDTAQNCIEVQVGIKYRTDNDTLIFFSKNSALTAGKEMEKICLRVHEGVQEPQITPEKESITPQHAEFVVNKPLHWAKKL